MEGIPTDHAPECVSGVEEACFKETFEEAAVGIAHVALPEGRFLRVNAWLCDLVGYTKEELLRLTFGDITHPADRARNFAAVSQLLDGSLRSYSTDKRYVHKNGSTVWVHLTAKPAYDATGKPKYVIAVVEDIGAKRAVEEEQQHSYSLLQATLDATADGILVVDTNRKVSRYNQQFVSIFGVPNELLDTGDDDVLLSFARSKLRDPDTFLRKVMELYADPDSASFDEFELVDGRIIERYSKPQRLNGQAVGRVWSFRDVTQRRQAERALLASEQQLRQAQKMEAIGRLAGGVAHDFNNLLVVIGGCSELALQCLSPDDPVREPIAQVVAASQRAVALTRQLLAFSRQQVLEPCVLDLNALIVDTVAMLRRVIGEDIELRTRLDPNLSRVTVDPGQLVQVLMNLTINARDAMAGGGKLTIETSNVTFGPDDPIPPNLHPGDHVKLVVSDTGCGMDADTLSQLFEPFFTTKQFGEGTGLGLSTVYGIVRQSGGAIDVESTPEAGTTFTIYLPAASPASAAIPAHVDEAPHARASETVLLVEDDEWVRAVIRRILEGAGYRVLAAAGPEQATEMALVHQRPIHILLTDVVLPRLNGRELARRVQRVHPEAKALYMSGYTSSTIMGVLEGDSPFIQKPFTEGTLLRKLSAMLA